MTATNAIGAEIVHEIVCGELRRRGWTGKGLAAMIGVSQPAVSRAISANRSSRNLETLDLISRQLGFEPDYLRRVLRGEEAESAAQKLRQYRAQSTSERRRRTRREPPRGSLPTPGPSVAQRSISEQQRVQRARQTAQQRLADMERRLAELENEVAQLRQAAA